VRHAPVGPGEVALGTLADPRRQPARGVRPRTAAEVAFLGLGPAAEAFLRAAAAAGTLRLEHELCEVVALEPIWGRRDLVRALERATRFRRFSAADVLQTARTQRWPPEDVLRALVAAEITARDRANQRLRLKAASFPVPKSLDDFDSVASVIPAPTLAYVASLEWVHARENLLLVGPAGTGKSHLLI